MVNANVRMAIDDSGLKQKFVAEKAGISEQALSAMLNERQKIGVEEFFAFCRVLQKSPEELYNYQGQNEKGA